MAAVLAFAAAGCIAILDFSDYDTRALDDPNGPGGEGGPTDARVTIEAAANGAFELSADKDVSVTAGQSIPATITLGRVAGFNEPVVLGASAADPRLTVTLADSLLADDKSTSTATIAATTSFLHPEDLDVVVNGTAGTLKSDATIHVHVRPPAGSVDDTFGNAGVITIDPVQGAIADMAVGADGSLYFAGRLDSTSPAKGLIVKAKPNGMPDGAFGTNGVLSFSLGPVALALKGIVVLPNGAVIVSGRDSSSTANSYVIRTTPAGAIDTTFGNGGTGAAVITEDLRLDFTTTYDLALGADGKSFVLMSTLYSGGNHPLYVVEGRKDDGKALTTFADAGAARMPWGHAGTAGETILTFDGGRPLLVGSHQQTGVIAALLTTNGAFEPSYGDGGAIITKGPTGMYIRSKAATLDGANGDLVVLFSHVNGTEPGIFRLKPNGMLDTTFGTGGYIALPGSDTGAGIVIDKSHRIISKHDGNSLRRFLPDGKPDTSFGTNGVLTPADATGLLALQPDDKIIIAGSSAAGIVIRRYNP